MGFKIREHRRNAGISQAELSVRSGVSRTIISGLESGRISITSTKTLLRIADALGIKISDLFYGENA